MSDLISRQAAIDALGGNEPVGDPSKMDDDDVVKMWERIRIINIINKLPSAQPEIIRCKDCKHQTVFHYTDKRFKDPDRYVYGCDLTPDGCYLNCFDSYCSEAERRTDGKST